MKQTRRKFTKAFKLKVVLEALKERKTMAELAKQFELQPNQISVWKREFLTNADRAFDAAKHDKDQPRVDVDTLYKKIGMLEVERDFLKKSLWKTGL